MYKFLIGIALLVSAAHAEEPPLPQAFKDVADGKADCTEISDKCTVCKKDGDVWHCSLPGIACQAEKPVCQVPKP